MIALALAVTGWFFAVWFAFKYLHWRTRYGNLYRRNILLERYVPVPQVPAAAAAPRTPREE